jgi:hypothetical protein
MVTLEAIGDRLFAAANAKGEAKFHRHSCQTGAEIRQ